MRNIPDESIALIVTSPPYWNLVDYNAKGQYGQGNYEEYLEEMLSVWAESQRVLEPNGKIAIVTPIVPLTKKQDNKNHTRKLLNINSDLEQKILSSTRTSKLHRFSLYIWQKQTSKKMFGSYPYPPNIYEDNTIEFINVFVKEGKPKKADKKVKEASRISQEEWLNLSMQVWPIMPSDIKRKGGHPAPFPLEIPERLIAMYTFKAVSEIGFAGDIVLDMFNGSGTTTLAAFKMGRRYLGIDINPDFCKLADARIAASKFKEKGKFILQKVQMPSKKREECSLSLFKNHKN
ncbi:MAG: site-specific DNA-methyltransferase [Phycisphaerae bacterium]|nr:site-specific DNA-methyltransferase [Phycisphaerae bacterium]